MTMELSNPFKLEKLTITALNDGNEPDPGADPFEVMFNPETFAEHIGNKLQTTTGINTPSTSSEARPAGSEPEKLELHLVIDGTGAADFGLPMGLGGRTQSVKDQIDAFKALCYNTDGELHAPHAVEIKWGDVIRGNYRLQSADITYKSFDRNASPLRAELDVVFIKHQPAEQEETPTAGIEQEPQSPDLTKTRMVKAGDTLPLLSREIYGSARHYLFAAAANNLNNFRRLEPGRQLVFPPLEK